MRICFVYPSVINPQTGGVERITHALARFLESRGYSLLFLACGHGDKGTDPRQYLVPEILINDSDSLARYMQGFFTDHRVEVVINQAATNIQFCQILHRSLSPGISLVSVIHNSPSGTSAHYGAVHEHRIMRAGMGLLITLIKSRAASLVFQALYKIKYRSHYRSVVKHSDRVVVFVDGYKHELSMLIGRGPSKRIVSIANFLDFDDKSNHDKHKEVLYVGRLNVTQKRVDLLLRVWRQVQDSFPDWSLIIVGDGEDRTELEALATRLGALNLKFLGQVDPQANYTKASVLCMTSTYEGFPLTLIEAMHFGVVPIAFDSFSAARDIIQTGVDGCLVTPFLVDEYAASLSSLLSDVGRRERMAAAARQSSARYSAESIGESWIRLLSSLKAG